MTGVQTCALPIYFVLQHYRGYIRYAARISGQADQDAEDYITETLLKAIFKFRMDRVSPPFTTE